MNRVVWTNRSVLALAADVDPVQVITSKARAVVLQAIEAGWTGPPYDPFALAEYLKIRVVARQDIAEARTVPAPQGFLIEFNPNRPAARIKYSICHELAHTLFPDCSERVRNRVTHRDASGDDWQLETLCNLGAAELLLPIGSTPSLEGGRLSMESVLETRKVHQVSAEAVMLRGVRLTDQQCCVFSCSHRQSRQEGHYIVDYAVGSRSWAAPVGSGTVLPDGTVAAECQAIGLTARGHETWEGIGSVRIECLSVPPYPNQIFPRVLGIVHTRKQAPTSRRAEITYVQGDATRPHGRGVRLLAQIVNDGAFTWGSGFSLAVRNRWPAAQRAFRHWAQADRRNLRLGSAHLADIEDDIVIASMIAQHGYGPSTKARIRYTALRTCLSSLAREAIEREATVHMPKIGSGQAGGSWSIISELVEEELCSRGIRVFVYELPFARRPAQPALEFVRL